MMRYEAMDKYQVVTSPRLRDSLGTQCGKYEKVAYFRLLVGKEVRRQCWQIIRTRIGIILTP